jgi:uncharacterized cupredoxin-like copper-binding protein
MNLQRVTTTAIFGMLALVAAVALAGCGSSDTAASASDSIKQTMKEGMTAQTGTGTTALGNSVDAQLTEMKIITPTTAVKAGKVNFTAKNTGTLIHELIVMKTDKPADKLGTGQKISEKDSVGEISELKPGKTGNVTLDLKPGNYVLICNVPGHYMAGMYKPLQVK